MFTKKMKNEEISDLLKESGIIKEHEWQRGRYTSDVISINTEYGQRDTFTISNAVQALYDYLDLVAIYDDTKKCGITLTKKQEKENESTK